MEQLASLVWKPRFVMEQLASLVWKPPRFVMEQLVSGLVEGTTGLVSENCLLFDEQTTDYGLVSKLLAMVWQGKNCPLIVRQQLGVV